MAELDTLAGAVQRKVPTVTREEAAEIAVHVLADGLAIALADAGWELSADIDEPLRCRLGDRELEPLDEVLGMAEGTHLARPRGRRERRRSAIAEPAARAAARRAKGPIDMGPSGC